MSDRRKLEWTLWASVLGVMMIPATWIWYASARNSDLNQVKANIAEVRQEARDSREAISDLKGDVKAIRAVLEQMGREGKKP